MMVISEDPEMIVVIILLEHPSGLSYCQLLTKAKEKGIKNDPLFDRVLKRLQKPPWSLVKKDKSGNYTLGIVNVIADILRAGEFSTVDKVSAFLNLLYEAHDRSDKKQNESFYDLVAAYLQNRVNQLTVMTYFLAVFFYDKKIRELWLEGQRRIFDLNYELRDQITEKFFKKRPSYEISDEALNDLLIVPLNKKMADIELLNKTMCDLLDKLEVEKETKRKLKNYLGTEPILEVLSEQPKAIMKLIKALKEQSNS